MNGHRKSNFHRISISFRINELAGPIASTCAKAHIARLHRWRVTATSRKLDQLWDRTYSPSSEVNKIYHFTISHFFLLVLKPIIDAPCFVFVCIDSESMASCSI